MVCIHDHCGLTDDHSIQYNLTPDNLICSSLTYVDLTHDHCRSYPTMI